MRLRDADPPTVMCSIAPQGFSVLHVHREPTASRPAGGELAVIYRDQLGIRPSLTTLPSTFETFEYQLVRVTFTKPTFVIANIYRPPSTSVSRFHDELSEFLSVVGATSDRLVVCGDTNCPGPDSTSIDPDLDDVFSAFGLTQQVYSPTRYNNVLDVLASDDLVAVNNLRVDDAGLISDHRLVAASISALRFLGSPCS